MSPASQLEKRLFPATKTSASSFSMFKIGSKSTKFDPLLLELPQQLELAAALLTNGENIYSAFDWIAERSSGDFAKALNRLIARVNLGQNIEVALALLARELPSPLLAEFSNKLILCLDRGTPLAEQLQNLAESARGQLRVQLLRQAGKNEIKMLIPLVFVILPVTILVAVYPSFQLLQVNF